jgi:hypothetical protein
MSFADGYRHEEDAECIAPKEEHLTEEEKKKMEKEHDRRVAEFINDIINNETGIW